IGYRDHLPEPTAAQGTPVGSNGATKSFWGASPIRKVSPTASASAGPPAAGRQRSDGQCETTGALTSAAPSSVRARSRIGVGRKSDPKFTCVLAAPAGKTVVTPSRQTTL